MGRPARTEDRESRGADTRMADERSEDKSEFANENPTSPLYVPRDKWPAGKVCRWVCIEVDGAANGQNWSKMTAVGWVPVPREMMGELFPTIPMPGVGDRSDGFIIYGGLCLCMRDERLVKRDRQRQEAETQAQQDSIKSYVEGGNSLYPRFNQSGPVEYGRAKAAFKE